MSLPYRFFGAVALLFVIFATGPVAAQGTPAKAPAENAAIARDIAYAGIWRLQAQRIAKLYRQIGLGVYPDAAKRQLTLALAQADDAAARLERFAKKPSTQRSFARSQSAWRELREFAGKPYQAESAERIGQLAEEMSIHVGKLAFQIESEAETATGRLLDQSARLNMLAQRLARLYLQVQSGDRSQGMMVDLEQTRREFATGLRELETAPENSPASRDALALSKNQWIFFDSAVQRMLTKGNDGNALQNVATSSERIGESLDLVTAQYSRDIGTPVRAAR